MMVERTPLVAKSLAAWTRGIMWLDVKKGRKTMCRSPAPVIMAVVVFSKDMNSFLGGQPFNFA